VVVEQSHTERICPLLRFRPNATLQKYQRAAPIGRRECCCRFDWADIEIASAILYPGQIARAEQIAELLCIP
jgi:hypothetical protein